MAIYTIYPLILFCVTRTTPARVNHAVLYFGISETLPSKSHLIKLAIMDLLLR
jgi:hypothetical protein